MDDKKKTALELTNDKSLELAYFQIVDVWKRLCEEHSLLLDAACNEYSLLLSSELDELEVAINEKQDILLKINTLEELRAKLIDKANELFTLRNSTDTEKSAPVDLSSVGGLIATLEEFEARENGRHLQRFNNILIDIIEKIQVQNRKNQLFINKALESIKDMRFQVMGEKKYVTYDAKGGTTSKATNNANDS
jgi:flagellar biosynthesis/type III secretory pathway chaperone